VGWPPLHCTALHYTALCLCKPRINSDHPKQHPLVKMKIHRSIIVTLIVPLVSFLALLPAVTISTSFTESRLRSSSVVTTEEELNVVDDETKTNDGEDLDTINRNRQDGDVSGGGVIDIKSTFNIEKSFQCKGSMDGPIGGATKKCEATMKKKDSIGLYDGTTAAVSRPVLVPEDLMNDVASEMEKLYDSILPTIDSFLPHDDVMTQIVDFQKNGFDDRVATTEEDIDDPSSSIILDEDGSLSSMTVAFGGHFTAEWGCNVTFTKSVGKLSRIISCGAKSTEGSSMEGGIDESRTTTTTTKSVLGENVLAGHEF
jgi:hypothetical protein